MRLAQFPLWSIVLLALASPLCAHAAGDNIFAGVQVHTIRIDFSQPAYWDSLTQYYNEGLEQYMAATVTADGVVYDSVGVRLKGNASYTHPNNKKPFRLSFDEYIGSQRWDGLKGVHLNNCWEDPTFMREKLHLDFCRAAGIPAPRGNFAELYINGELWGFYSLVEHVDKTFLSSRFGASSGNLYKAVDGLLNPIISDFKWYGSDPAVYYNRYEFKTDDSPDPWTDLIAVLDSLNNSPAVLTALPPVVNLPNLYRAIAADVMLGNLDSYAGSGRNFYVYFNPSTGKMEWTIWDAGMSFGSYWGAATNYETLSLSYVSNATNRPLVGKVHSTPAFEAAYLQAACELFTEYFSASNLFPQIETIHNLIQPYVYADPRKMYTNAQFETNIVSDITVGGHRKPGLQAFITAREANIASQLAALGISCEQQVLPGDMVVNEFAADNTVILDPAGDAEDWIEFYNNTDENIDVGGMYLTDTPALHTKWQFPAGTSIAPDGYLIVWADNELTEEGLHANFKLSASGEYIILSDAAAAVLDSVGFGSQTTNLTMARIPNGTGPFVQGEPTFNADNGNGVGGLVINEFAADNTVILDPAGDAEDWIEFYNNTDESIDVGGMYLTDTPSLHTKWQFPAGTSIAADGYLIVWADNELTEAGLHANFKLSASGEYVILSDASAAVIDSVGFGAQTTNLTMARIPNGTGEFVQGTPTFNASNGYGNMVTPGEVVINEFLASNGSFPDPAGELDDWIELYNTTDHDIALGGLYLSDDPAAPNKWQFPDGTTIATDGYLLIWADEDLDQEGLHAGFKLSSGGESVVFSNPDLSVVDSTSFGAQTIDVSMARIPNGTGPFVAADTPTPGAANENPGAVAGGAVARTGLGVIAPNPVLQRATLEFALAQSGWVQLQIFDVQGRKVATLVDGEMAAGDYRASFDGRPLASGVYLCRLHSGEVVAERRLLVVR
jgi:spore coat protein CotH